MYYEDKFIQQGWQCPICGRVYSPSTAMCYYCGDSHSYVNTTSTSDMNVVYPDKRTLDDWLKDFLCDSRTFRVPLDGEKKVTW